ncbi:MAG TPA: hypothetical protein VE197_10190, partial [Mycobacterium sp.]|nr:hypothetical protein [Mycobacterium sp.]
MLQLRAREGPDNSRRGQQGQRAENGIELSMRQRLHGRRPGGRLLVLFAAGLIAALLSGILASQAVAQDCTDQFTPKLDSDWGTAGNWSKQSPPTSSDVACWASGTTAVVSSNDTTATAKALEGGNLTISGGSLTLAGPEGSTIASFTESGGSLDGPGALTLSGTFSWSGGNISVKSALAITQTSGQTFSIGGKNTPILGGGSISTASPVSITNTNFAAYKYTSDSTLSTTSTATFAPGTYPGGSALAITAPAFVTTGDTGIGSSLHLTDSKSSLSGTLSALSLSVDAGSTLSLPTGGGVSVQGGAISGTITGKGTYKLTGGSTTTIASGATLSPDNVTVSGGTLSVNSAATYATAGTTTVSGGTLNLGPAASIGNLTETAGALNGPGSLGVSGNFSWTGGYISVGTAIDITQTGGGTFSIAGTGSPVLGGGKIDTSSDIAVSNTNLYCAGYTGNASVITTGTVTFAPGNYSGCFNPTITAAGYITTDNTTFGGTLTQTASLSSLAGTLTAATFNLDQNTTLTLPTGAALSVQGGTISGTITGKGTYKLTGGSTTTIASGA